MAFDPMQLILDNIFYIVIIGVVIYAIMTYLKISQKKLNKPINRSEIERQKFIERMKHNSNTNVFQWLYRDKKVIGKILYYRDYIMNPKGYKIAEMVVKPKLFWRFVNPLGKTSCFMINLGHFDTESFEPKSMGKFRSKKTGVYTDIYAYEDRDKEGKVKVKEPVFNNTVNYDLDKIIMPSWISFDYYFGIYYDLTIPDNHMQIIKNDNLIRTDLNELASVYYCKSQEQSTFDPIRAHQMALEEKRIELELAKTRGKSETI